LRKSNAITAKTSNEISATDSFTLGDSCSDSCLMEDCTRDVVAAIRPRHQLDG
jgi:hypothetical protein